MKNRTRDSGIDIIGNVSWGTHIGQLFTSKEEIFDVMVPYIRQGLMDNELCLWVYSDNISYYEIKDQISKIVKDVDSYLESGQLLLIPYSMLYLKNGSFNE